MFTSSSKEKTLRHWKKLAALGVAVVTFAGIGLAWAAWTAGGTGSGAAKAGTAKALTTSDATASVVDLLYPSGSADVAVTIDNPNPYAVTVTSVAGNGAITSGNATCDASNGVSFTDQTGLTLTVPANDHLTHVFANAASMSNASVDACQGQTFTIPVTVSGASS